ncbi:MAG: AsnC family transcriptional regulator [Firmicutes bacterium]|nr:AsnC family transcriptional regulator [Bacillota bacterium]
MEDKKQRLTPEYLLGTSEQQKWAGNYFFNPRGIGFLEPGCVPLDNAAMSAYNVAKSSYQIRPEVFNIEYISRTLGIGKDEIVKRLHRLYDEHLIMFVMNPATQVYGWGLYYWFVKLKEGVTKEAKAKFSDWYQNKDDICTGYEMNGDFDFFNGNHMRVLDNLLYDVIGPWKDEPEVEYVHICPIRRDIRESHVNMWDAPGDSYREVCWGKGQMEKLAKIQNKMDLTDLKIVEVLNAKKPVENLFDFSVLSEISGLDPKDMLNGIKDVIEVKRILVPLFFINFMKLGLTNHMFIIRTFQNIPCYRKAQIADELAAMPEFNAVFEFSDSFYDMSVWAYNEISDIKALRDKLNAYSEIEDIKEADITKQYRRWVCRLDDENGFWEECVFTDDFLQDRTGKNAAKLCRFCQDRKEVK